MSILKELDMMEGRTDAQGTDLLFNLILKQKNVLSENMFFLFLFDKRNCQLLRISRHRKSPTTS